MKPKYHLILLLILVAAVTLTACTGGARTGESKELNLYAWSEYVPQALLDNFTAQTGIKVNYDTYSSNEELMAKLQVGRSGYDVIIPSDYTVAILAGQGLLEKIDKSQLPNFAKLSPQSINLDFDPDNQYSVPYQWGTACLAVNTAKVSRPITRWADLWSPDFSKSLVLPDDGREVIGMALVSLGFDPNTMDPAQLEQAKNRLLELLPNVRLFDSDSPKSALLTGEVVAGMMWNGEAFLAISENEDISYIFPQEGCSIWFDNLAIPKDAPHLDAALKFINFVLEPAQSMLITLEFPYSNPNLAALELLKENEPEMYEAYMANAATNPSAEDLQRTYGIRDVGDATPLYDRIWTEIKGGQ